MSQDGARTPNETGEGKSIEVGWFDTLEVGEEIRELFQREGEEDAAHRFARTYPLAGELGARSIIARDSEGLMVMHAAAVPRLFRGAGVSFTGALLENFVVAESYRDFWSPINFLRQTVEILKTHGTFDFVYTDPGENAFALARAAGFDLLDSLRTFVFPLVPGWPTHMLCDLPLTELDVQRAGWREGIPPSTETEHPSEEEPFRIVRAPALYESWVRENLTDESEWILLRPPGQAEAPPVARVLVTPLSSHRSLGIMDLTWNEKRVSLESVFYQVALQARRSGFRKLAIQALGLSRLGQAVDRYGFVARTGERAVVVKALRDDLALPPAEQWLLTWMDVHS